MTNIGTKSSKQHGNQRSNIWTANMLGHISDGFVHPHKEKTTYIPYEGFTRCLSVPGGVNDLSTRLQIEDLLLSKSATRSKPAVSRAQTSFSFSQDNITIPLDSVEFRTNFERDRDSIEHSKPFRRLAGKTQVHLNPSDHQRTRLTHALEVSQIACAISASLRLNVQLTQAIALGHDCGHGPGGHASEDALNDFLPEGFNHAIFGADVTLRHLNLDKVTLDGIRNHSWSLDTPLSPEGEVVSFADRIAYVCHDLEDALGCSMVNSRQFPKDLFGFLNLSRGKQINIFIRSVVQGTTSAGFLAMNLEQAEILGSMRKFNNENIYQHPDSIDANKLVIKTLQELVNHYFENPSDLPDVVQSQLESADVQIRPIVEFVAGMTDDFALRMHNVYVRKGNVDENMVLFHF